MPDSLDAVSSAASRFLEGNEPALALPLYLQAVSMATAAGAQERLSGLLGDLAVAYRRLGNIPDAITTNRQAIATARACKQDLDIARWSGNLGGILLRSNDLDAAEVAFREAMEAAARTGLPDQMSIAAGHWAAIMAQRGRFSEGVETMARARASAADNPIIAAIVREQELDLFLSWAHSLRKELRIREAKEVIERALSSSHPDTEQEVSLLVLLGDIAETEGNITAAADALERAADTSEALGEHSEARTLRDLAERMRA